MSAVWIVQHGEKAVGGEDPWLTDRGAVQARAAGRRLAAEPVDLVVTSPLRRARETARQVTDVLGVGPARIDERLRERINRPDGLTDAQFLAVWARSTAERDWQPPFGDSSRAAGRRFRDALMQYADISLCVVLVAHGGVTVDLVRDAVGDDRAGALLPGVIADGVRPGALTHLAVRDGVLHVLALGSADHL